MTDLKKIILSLFFILCALCKLSYAQELNNSRPAFDLKLFVDDSTFYQAHMNTTLYIVKEGIVQVFPDEKLFIEADLLNDSLVNFKVVPEIRNKEKTLTITFIQEHDGKKHTQMRLYLDNPFSKNLEYNARIYLMKQKKWVSTSVLPVLPKIIGNEIWPDIITTIVLDNFHLKSPNN
jgi:hypothetical protein